MPNHPNESTLLKGHELSVNSSFDEAEMVIVVVVAAPQAYAMCLPDHARTCSTDISWSPS